MDPIIDDDTKVFLNKLAPMLDAILNPDPLNKTMGFAIMMFKFGEIKRGRMNWISNAQRKDMITAMKEMIAHFEGRAPEPPKTKQ